MARTATVQIKQIAERVGLSPSTVSIVLNGRGDEMRISKESQRRVLEAAKEMSYRPASADDSRGAGRKNSRSILE